MSESAYYYNIVNRALARAPGARDKYETSGRAKKFPGVTIVHWNERGARYNQAIVAFAASLKEDLRRANLLDKFSFLPQATYHTTVYDIATWIDAAMSQ